MSRLTIALEWNGLEQLVPAGHDRPVSFAGVDFRIGLQTKGDRLQCRLHSFQLPATWSKLRLAWSISFLDQRQQPAFPVQPPLECTLDGKQTNNNTTEWLALPGAWPTAYETIVDDEEHLTFVCDLVVWDVQYPAAHMLQCMFETLCRDHYLAHSRRTWNSLLDEIKMLRIQGDALKLQLQLQSDLPARKRARHEDDDGEEEEKSVQRSQPRPTNVFASLATMPLHEMTREELQAAQQSVMSVQLRIFEATKELDNCTICCETITEEMVLLPCGHRRICRGCVDKLPRPSKCPMCNCAVESTGRVF